MYPDLLVHAPLSATYLLRLAEMYARSTGAADTSVASHAVFRFVTGQGLLSDELIAARGDCVSVQPPPRKIRVLCLNTRRCGRGW
jgi:hypothetical protein